MRFATKIVVTLVVVPAVLQAPGDSGPVPAIAASSPLSSVEQP